MPTPSSGARRKAKGKRRAGLASTDTTTNLDSIYYPQIDNCEGWEAVVDVLCTFFTLPDLSSRSGLKEMHANFNALYTRIDKVFEMNARNSRVRGGIVGIYTRMCVDSILRNKLFEKGILVKILPLLDIDETRHLALRCLNIITQHGGLNARLEIAKHANRLTKLMGDLPDDETVAELGISILSHSVSVVLEGDETPLHPRALKALDMTDILKTILETIKKPSHRPKPLYGHAIDLIVMSALHASYAFEAYPSAIGFLVAGMRSKDWATRGICLNGLIRLFQKEHDRENRAFDPVRLVGELQQGRAPSQLNEILDRYGPSRSEVYQILSCTTEFQKAMFAVAEDRDFYKLGLKQASLIPKAEHAVMNGRFETEDPRTGRRRVDSMGLPFTMWIDSLPLASQAIRAKMKPDEQDFADILDIKYMIAKERNAEVVRVAKAGIERNPEQAYFYYAIAVRSEDAEGLRAAKKGLKCKQITPFLQSQLLSQAVEHAGTMGLRLLEYGPNSDDRQLEEAAAFLTSALEDAKVFMDSAMPDSRFMLTVGSWVVLLTLLMTDKLSPDLRELDDIIRKIDIGEQFSKFIGVTAPRIDLQFSQEAAIEHYAPGLREFSRIFDHLDEINGKDIPSVDHEKLQDDLSTWLENVHLDDGTLEHNHCHHGVSGQPSKVNFNNVALYQCSWCGNPSAVLRKCAGCGETRYCDAGCQKAHWSKHKKTCKS